MKQNFILKGENKPLSLYLTNIMDSVQQAVTPKNLRRIEEMRSVLQFNSYQSFKTSKCARYVHRDFYFISVMLYTSTLRKSLHAENILTALNEIEKTLDDLRTKCEPYFYLLPQADQLENRNFQLTIIHPYCSKLLRLLKTIDGYFTPLYLAQMAGLINKEDRYAIMRETIMSYEQFKRIVGKHERKSVDELLDEVETLED